MADKVVNMAKITVAIEKTASKKKELATTQQIEVKKNTAASRYLNKKVKLHNLSKRK